MFFSFPENARWNAERHAVEFGVEIGEYRGVVRVPRRMFQRLLLERPPPPRALRRGTTFSGEHRRAEAAPAPVDRGWECRDQRAGLVLGVKSRHLVDGPPAHAER